MLLGLPLAFLGFVAGIVGLVLAIIHRREWQLGFMAAAGILFVATFFLENEDITTAVAMFYVVIAAACCGNWFFFRRKRVKQAEQTAPSGDRESKSQHG